MNVVEMPPEEFALVVNSIMEGKLEDPFREWESISLADVRGFESFCSSCLENRRASHYHGRAIA